MYILHPFLLYASINLRKCYSRHLYCLKLAGRVKFSDKKTKKIKLIMLTTATIDKGKRTGRCPFLHDQKKDKT